MEFYKFFLKDKSIIKLLQDKNNNQISSGYLFKSPDEKTNYYYLKSLAMGFMCNNNGCLQCADCLKVIENTHPDILQYPKDKLFTVNDAKDIVIEATKKPMIANCKIIIINNIDNSSEEAQNKLLKILEEPPKNVFFFVSTTSFDKVLPTIKSRLIKIEIRPFSKEIMSNIIEDYKSNSNYDLALVKGKGYLGKTLNILDNSDYNFCYNLVKEIVFDLKSSVDVLKFIPSKIDKNMFNCILENLSSFYRDLLMINLNQVVLVENENLLNKFMNIKSEFSVKALIEILKLIDKSNEKQYFNVSLNLIMESLLVKILEVKFLCK